MQVTVSVPGKVHLMGEHAVVYGKPALLAAVNLRMRVTIEECEKNSNSIQGLPITIISQEPTDYIEHIISLVVCKYNWTPKLPVKISVDSEIPAGYHLGSSAAVAVATIGALTYYGKKIWNPQAINQLAYEAEKMKHGNPSGGDNTAITMGGFLWFRKELEFLKSMWQLPLTLPDALNHFYLVDSGKPKETTGEMVANVKKKVVRFSEKYGKLFDLNEQQTKKIAIALKEGCEHDLLEALSLGEKTLEKIGVVSKRVVPFIRQIEESGGAAKILGGGGIKKGTGFLLCYHTNEQKLREISKKFGFPVQVVQLGGEGIRLEKEL